MVDEIKTQAKTINKLPERLIPSASVKMQILAKT
jgi:hypothetical protein